jgi:SOS-response transcriptional repressor LexA
MNIKEQIGQRILNARKAKGLTQAGLAELAGDFKQTRINNWERGIRTPGAKEIKLLANVLDVSPAFLMCLTERSETHPLDKNHTGGLLPLLRLEQANNSKAFIEAIKENHQKGDISFIPIDMDLAKLAGEYAFALKVSDESMEPDLYQNDLLIICPDFIPKPGNLVLAQVEENTTVIIRRYKLLSISKHPHQYELLATNKHWPDIHSSELNSCRILGTVIYLHRGLATV